MKPRIRLENFKGVFTRVWFNIAMTSDRLSNLVPRASLLCLPCRWEKRPWSRLVTWPPRIWVVKKSVGREGWQSVLIVAVVNFVGFKISSSRKNYPLYQGLMWKFADEEMLHYFCCVQDIEDFRSKEIRQPNGAQTFPWLAHVKRHVPSRSETRISVSWIFECEASLFSSLCGILDVKKYFCHTAD